MRTSTTDPIRVDFLPSSACPLPGRIGLTFAPGKKDERGLWNRSLDADVERLSNHYRASLLISLLEDFELKVLGIGELFASVSRAGVRVRRVPVADGRAPHSTDEVVDAVRIALAVASAGDTVVIQCRGGLGRAGTIASCCLVALGSTPSDAIRAVRAARPGAVETRDQESFVERFRVAWRTAAPVMPAASRFVACLLGGAIGDALGYPVEFSRTASDIERLLGPVVPEWLPSRPGERAVVSDDTQMTLITAEGLVRAVSRLLDRGICSTEAVLQGAYHRWLSTQTGEGAGPWQDASVRGWLLDVPSLHAQRAPGNTCLGALRKSCSGELCPTVNTPPNDSKGCGAVMRSAPIGLAARDVQTAFALARDAAVLTHGHPSGYLSAAYFAAVIHGLVRDVPIAEAMATADERVRTEPGAGEVMKAIAGARKLAARPPTRQDVERLGGGWVGEEALAIAVLCALTTPDGSPQSVATSIWRSVAHGGDSDSTGSLTGNLLGAMHGLGALPKAWVENVELREVVERLAIDLHASTVLGMEPDARRYPPN
ncbi:MAG TPA: ADP-ribosylglycohydrolase family protein [Polyangiaceae bacterium]